MLRCLTIAVATAALIGGPTAPLAAKPPAVGVPSAGNWFAEEGAAVASSDASAPSDSWSGLLADEPIVYDQSVAPAQMQFSPLASSPIRQPVRLAQQPRPAARAAASSGLASIPYMIGDTGAGTCIGFSGLLEAGLSHPALGCSRLNISEANSALPTDRFYWSYRHFHNAAGASSYQFSKRLNLDQHTLAWENTFWDRAGSLELRAPVQHQLRSDVFALLVPNQGVVDPLDGDDRQVELGNISLIFKMLLLEREQWIVSGGLGATLPTARDVEYGLLVDGTVDFANAPGLTADTTASFLSVFGNETIYLSPYLAWARVPRSRWFHQGFLQFEVAANPSRATVDGSGVAVFEQNGVPIGVYDFFTPIPERVELFSQTLMRLNLGWGYIFSENRDPDRFRRWAGLLELHYTTTLQDANLSEVPLSSSLSAGTVPLQQIMIGNHDNRVDILNAAAGISGQLGQWIVTNGVAAPIREERGFDFEYNLQLQRLF